ncbi:MAG: hypothetical protein ACSLFJ_15505 [Immundisolibacter sp.]|uniref:hypothetical protein n=1 Tax=Immundisolibacter sp. TaxID=1934948 RepID=UPI003EE36A29
MLLSRLSALLSLFLFLFVEVVAAQNNGFVDRVQMGDNDLDCRQIADQVSELEAILAPLKGDQGAVRGATETATRSRTGEVVAGVAKALPFGSIFGDIAKDVLGRRAKEADARVGSVRARKEYLVDMFLKRKCRVADLENAAGKEKAKIPGSGVVTDGDAAPSAPSAPGTDAGRSAVEPQAAPPALETDTSPLWVETPTAAKAAAAPKKATVKARKAVPAPAVIAPESTRGPLFVLDFRLAFRTSADPDGKDGAMGLALGGVPLTVMQAITDNAYVALLKDLAAAGFEVLNPELTAAASTRGSLPAPARSGDYLYFAPSGAPLAQAPGVTVPGSDAALAETRTALAQAVSGRKPGAHYAIGVWYVDFARIKGDAEDAKPQELETRLAVAAGSHVALVEPAEDDETPARAVRVLNLGRDLVSREPYGQVRLPAAGSALELRADPERFRALVERQLKRARSALIGSLPPPPVIDKTPAKKPRIPRDAPGSQEPPGARAP